MPSLNGRACSPNQINHFGKGRGPSRSIEDAVSFLRLLPSLLFFLFFFFSSSSLCPNRVTRVMANKRTFTGRGASPNIVRDRKYYFFRYARPLERKSATYTVANERHGHAKNSPFSFPRHPSSVPRSEETEDDYATSESVMGEKSLLSRAVWFISFSFAASVR